MKIKRKIKTKLMKRLKMAVVRFLPLKMINRKTMERVMVVVRTRRRLRLP